MSRNTKFPLLIFISLFVFFFPQIFTVSHLKYKIAMIVEAYHSQEKNRTIKNMKNVNFITNLHMRTSFAYQILVLKFVMIVYDKLPSIT